MPELAETEAKAPDVDAVDSADGGDAADSGDAGDAGQVDATSAAAALHARHRHRLRDLDRRGRLVAALFAAALLLAPALAFAWALPDWAPSNDPALMAFRVLDVGTSRTPLTGQPSTSVAYSSAGLRVHHLGPVHFYLMALPVRLLGAALGMLVVSVLITGGSVLVAAWATFRQLGPEGGIPAAVILSLITFTTGASTLVTPTSSVIAGYPVLCSMVLLWCLLRGDVRLLPLAVGVISFAAQQHLSVLPALGTAVVLTTGLAAWIHRRRLQDRMARQRLIRWGSGATALGLVLWAPVILQQAFGDRGNLTTLAQFTADEERPSVGWSVAVRQVVHAVGLPPVLGRQNLSGFALVAEASAFTWLSAGLVLAAVAVSGWWLYRSKVPGSGLAVMAGIVVVGGLMNGASVPDSLEQSRLALYHWVWPLLFFVLLTLSLAAIELVRRTRWMGARSARSASGGSGASGARSASGPVVARWLGPVLVTAAVVAIVVPAALNPFADRKSNRLVAAYSPLPRHSYDSLTAQVLDHRDELGDSTLVLDRGGHSIDGIQVGLALELAQRDIDVRLPRWLEGGVDISRVVDSRTVDSGLVVLISDGMSELEPVPGDLIAETATVDVDMAAFDELVTAIEAADEITFSADLEAYLDSLPSDLGRIRRAQLESIGDQPRTALRDEWLLTVLLEHPLEQPQLDPSTIRRLRSSLPDPDDVPYLLQVYLLDRQQLLAYAVPRELGGTH